MALYSSLYSSLNKYMTIDGGFSGVASRCKEVLCNKTTGGCL